MAPDSAVAGVMPDLEVPGPLPPHAPCQLCGGRRFWLPVIGSSSRIFLRWLCELCHPPGRADLVDAEYELGGKVRGSCSCST
jgi:hypothetical protein